MQIILTEIFLKKEQYDNPLEHFRTITAFAIAPIAP